MMSSIMIRWNHLLVDASITKDLPSKNLAISVHRSSSYLGIQIAINSVSTFTTNLITTIRYTTKIISVMFMVMQMMSVEQRS